MSAAVIFPVEAVKLNDFIVDDLNQRLAEHIAAQSSAFHAQLKALEAARAANASAGTPSLPVVDETQFNTGLQRMQEHYTNGAGAVAARLPRSNTAEKKPFSHMAEYLYKFPQALMPHPLTPGAGSKALNELLEHAHTDCLDQVKESAQALLSAAQQAERIQAQTGSWTKQMDALRERDEAASRARLDALYTRAAATGQQHPNHRAQVLRVASYSSNLVNALYAGLAGAGFEMERGVSDAIHAALSPVTKAMQIVGKWTGNAVATVGMVFFNLL